ncbi:MAG: PDZ domain-containing protein [Nocardioidaceae bacterium]
MIGVNSAIATIGQSSSDQAGNIGVGFSIPIDQVVSTVKQLIETGQAEYPVIGAQVSVAPTSDGARILEVDAGSPADQAGLESGDVVTKIDGDGVHDGVELIVKIRSFAPGRRSGSTCSAADRATASTSCSARRSADPASCEPLRSPGQLSG